MGHPFVPQRYLRAFQSPNRDKWIWQHDKSKRTATLLPIKQVAQVREFYEQEDESALNMEVEIPGLNVVDKIRAGKKIDDDDRMHLTYFIATMLRRVPHARERAAGYAPEALAEVADKTRRELRAAEVEGRATAQRIAQLMAEVDRVEAKFQNELPIEVTKNIRAPWPFESWVIAIHSMYWRVLKTKGPSFFLTSDNPAHFFEGFGLKHPEAELILPLATDTLLHCSWQPGTEMLPELAMQNTVKEFNRRIATGASRFVFYHVDAQWVFEAARNRKEQLNRIRWVPKTKPRLF